MEWRRVRIQSRESNVPKGLASEMQRDEVWSKLASIRYPGCYSGGLLGRGDANVVIDLQGT